MSSINSARQMIGISDASDWPPKQIVMESFYLLTVGQHPIRGRGFWSVAVPVVSHTLQFVWLITGTDLTKRQVGRSRGDKYRTNMTMREELLKATYPWFAQKQNWSVQGNTPSGLVLKGTPVVPSEYIWWGPLTFLNRIDKTSGVVYGSASIQLTDMTETITS